MEICLLCFQTCTCQNGLYPFDDVPLNSKMVDYHYIDLQQFPCPGLLDYNQIAAVTTFVVVVTSFGCLCGSLYYGKYVDNDSCVGRFWDRKGFAIKPEEMEIEKKEREEKEKAENEKLLNENRGNENAD